MTKDVYALPPVSLAAFRAGVGAEAGVSRWFEITQARIDAFARTTEDEQFIHIDPEAAARTPFGATVAHGFLTLAMLSAMAYDALPPLQGQSMGVNYGFEKVRFVAPVRAGSRIRGRFRLTALSERAPGEWQARHGVTVEIEGGARPALVADWLSLHVLPADAPPSA